MKRFKQIIALFLSVASLLICACGSTVADEPTPESVAFSDDPAAISAASESVVMLNCYDRNGELYCTGSAFQCFEDGIFVTNYHVIDGVDKIQGSTESKLYFDFDEIIAADEERDIAILKTSAKPGVAVLPCGDSDALIKGENVVAIGSPKGFLNTVSKGTYSGMADFEGQSLIQFNASVSSGSSGGALFNDSGEVIGITSSQYSEGDDLNFAVPMSDVEEVWENKENYNSSVQHENTAITYSVEYIIRHQKAFSENNDFYISGYLYKKDEQDDLATHFIKSKGVPVIECASIVDNINSNGYKISFSFSDVDCSQNEIEHGTHVLLHCTSFDKFYDIVTIDSIEKSNDEPNYSEYIDCSDYSMSVHYLLDKADEYVDSLVTLTGCVSSVHRQSGQRCFFIVDSSDDVLGIDITDIVMREQNYEDEFDRLANKETVQFWISEYDVDYSKYCNMKPGEKIEITGWFFEGAEKKTIYSSQEISEIEANALDGYRITLPF